MLSADRTTDKGDSDMRELMCTTLRSFESTRPVTPIHPFRGSKICEGVQLSHSATMNDSVRPPTELIGSCLGLLAYMLNTV